MLFDGAEISIIDTTFARKVGCVIDEIQTQETYIPDVEMESGGSRQDRSDIYFPGGGDPDDTGQDEVRRPLVASTETAPDGGLSAPQIRMPAIADLQEFKGKDRDENRARIWISKVKSAFLREQASYEDKCLVFEDLLTGHARNQYNQLSRSTRRSRKDPPETFPVQYGAMVCRLEGSTTMQRRYQKKRHWSICIV